MVVKIGVLLSQSHSMDNKCIQIMIYSHVIGLSLISCDRYAPAVFCSTTTAVINGRHNGHIAYVSVGAVITYTCNAQHRFADGDSVKYIICLATGKYNADISHCEGEYNYVQRG